MKHLILILFTFYFCGISAQETNEDWSHFVTVINESKVNSEGIEFSPCYWNEFIVFVGARTKQKIFDKKLNEAYFNLYYSAINKNDQLEKTAQLSKTLNSAYHEGPASFYESGKRILFSSAETERGQLIMNEDKQVLNILYESIQEYSDWTKPVKSILNQEGYTSCHPTVHQSDTYVIFSSDRPGGYGKMDLYISRKDLSDAWSTPINLGPKVNSEENEVFPFLSKDGYLFFSTNSNKGDLDVYRTKIEDQAIVENPIALPKPINTSADDFGLILSSTGTHGYITSNRKGGKGKDDIYKISSTKSLFGYGDEEYNRIKYTVQSYEDRTPLSNVTVYWRALKEEYISEIDLSNLKIEEKDYEIYKTDDDGVVELNLSEGFNQVIFKREGYITTNSLLSSHQPLKSKDILLKKSIEIEKDTIIKYVSKPSERINNVEIKAGALLIFNNIYYDYNSDEIKKGAARELDELANIMLENPKLKIRLSSHTDSRGEADYNLILSEKRALSAKSYLVKKGVDSNNVRTLGYGETKLRNHCKDGTTCSEAEHIYNRRTEVIILEK